MIKEFEKNRINTVIKHIPGHGLAKSDSHIKLPIVYKKYDYLKKNDFYTFQNKKCLLAMTAHIVFHDIDSLHCATHSKKMINIIRKKIKFKNLLITDDISMRALKYSIKLNTTMAFNAGCNIVMHCNGKMNEMKIVAQNSPFLSSFIKKNKLLHGDKVIAFETPFSFEVDSKDELEIINLYLKKNGSPLLKKLKG